MQKKIHILIILICISCIDIISECKAQMFWNQACTFSGSSSSYVAVRDAGELDVTSFTLEAWINPSNSTSPIAQIILQKRNAGADGYTMYLNGGNVALRTGANTRLIGNIPVPSNAWTHIAGTYNSATNVFAVYVNGVIDSSVVIAGAAPVANADSIWIGKGFNSPFEGQMDELRIWDRALTSKDISIFRRTSLGSSTGIYSGLVLSLTFQDNDASGSAFSFIDWSGNGYNGINRGVSAFDMSNRPLTTIQMSDCIELDGSLDYLTAPDLSNISPTTQLTLSAWIYPRVYANSIILHKGAASGGVGTNYRLSLVGRKLAGAINGTFITSDDTIQLNRWTYVTFTYLASLGAYQFHINGVLTYGGTITPGNITDGTDSLYIGGTPSLQNFDGYIDEVRIIPDVKYTQTLNNNMFKSIDLSNGGGGNFVSYNFDGYAYNNGGSTAPLLRFNDSARFAHSGTINDQPISPLNRADNLNFESGYYLKSTNKRIPETGNSGTIVDSLEILNDVILSDVNVFVAVNHNTEQDLEISLFPPNGGVATLYDGTFLVSNTDNVTTIFDDQADSSLVNVRYVNFSPRIKPIQNINSAVTGNSSKGIWRLVIRDVTSSGFGDTGRIYGWGVQINNAATKPYLLDVTNTIEGFYRPALNAMIPDTMKYYLRNIEIPYGLYDSAKKLVTVNGFAQLNLTNVSSGVGMYLQLKHRNSIETWSGEAVYLNPLTYEGKYSFVPAASKAYASNMIQVDNSPVVFGIYGGDINQDGFIDGSDALMVDNDAFNFVTGYMVTDVTGDNVTDGTDFALVDNNAFNSITKEVPFGALRTDGNSNFGLEENLNNVSTQDPNIGVNQNQVDANIRIRTQESER